MPGRRTVHGFISYAPPTSDNLNAQVGGEVFTFKASGTLNVGDAVYSTANTDEVTKNTAQANYVTFIGFVVGGRRTNGDCVIGDLTVGAAITTIQAAQNGEEVLVQASGIGIGISSAAIVPGARVLAENLGTAGRLVAGTTAGLVLGQTLSNSTGANQWQKVMIGLR